jgi:hypothetical protein
MSWSASEACYVIAIVELRWFAPSLGLVQSESEGRDGQGHGQIYVKYPLGVFRPHSRYLDHII